MKILIFGAGSIGSVLGAFLARAGHDVSLLGRAWHLDPIEKQGLRVSGIWGEFRSKAFTFYRSAAEIPKTTAFDLIFLTVKSYDTEAAVAELAPLIKGGTTLVSFQNGLGNVETILKKVPAERYLAGRAIFGVEIKPGEVRVTVNADDLVVGSPTIPGAAQAGRLARELTTAKIPTRAVPDIMTYLWSKAIYNCALNGICTLGEMTYGDILKSKETTEAMKRVVRECYAVAEKMSVKLNPFTAEDYIVLLTHELIPKTAAHFPSMLQDLKSPAMRRGRRPRLEIDALNGAIVNYGETFSVPTPENRRISEEIREVSIA